jgi:hypothetical protein
MELINIKRVLDIKILCVCNLALVIRYANPITFGVALHHPVVCVPIQYFSTLSHAGCDFLKKTAALKLNLVFFIYSTN